MNDDALNPARMFSKTIFQTFSVNES